MITVFYPPYSFGGDAIYVHRLCTELVRAGHEVDVIHCADSFYTFTDDVNPRGFPISEGITVHTIETGYGKLSPLLSHQTGRPFLKTAALRKVLRSKEFDVIHFHNISLFGPSVLGIEPSAGAIRFYTAHDHWLVCPVSALWKNNERACEKPTCLTCTLRSGRPPQLWRYTGLLDRQVRHVDQFFAPSLFCRDMHRQRGFDRPMEVLPYFLPPAGTTLPAEQRPPHPRPYYLFAGRLEKFKGVQELLPHFTGEGAYDLVVIGAGGYEEELRRQAQGLSRVHFTGWLNHDDMRSYYQHALALVVPSLTYETFGIVVVEAYAQELPVIVHNLGSLPELVEESGGGLIYNNATQLARQLDEFAANAPLREEMGRRGHEAYLRQWTPSTHLAAYHRYIDHALARGASRAAVASA